MKDIEKIFKDSLENHELPYDTTAWKSLESKLPTTNIVKPINFIKLGLVGFIVAALAVSLFSILNTDEKQTDISEKKARKKVEKESASTLREITKKTVLTPEKNIITPQSIQKTTTVNSAVTSSNITQTKLEIINSNHQPTNVLINNLTSDKSNNRTNLVQIQEEIVISSPSFNIPAVSTKCKGEMLELENKNLISIVLKSPTGKLEIISSKSYLKTKLLQSGTYSINSTDETGNLTEIRSFNVINSPSISLHFDNELTYENGLPVLKANLESEENKLNWTLNNEKLNETGKNAVICALKKGAYELSVTATNEHGCKSTESKLIQVKDDYNLLAYNAFDPFSNDIRKTTFLPVALRNRTSPFVMTIFDPNDGGIVFETSDATQPWDGVDRRDGKLVNNKKVYIWKVSLKIPEAGEKSEYKGTITRI